MAQDDSFLDMLARLQSADDEAATRLYVRFANRLIALARTRLDQQLRQKLDPEDVLQSVFRSFFVRLRDGDFDLNNWDSMWSLLVLMTLRKCGRKAEFFHGKRRDVRAELSTTAAEEEKPDYQAVSRIPTPEEAAILAELVEQLLRSLPEHEQPILVLRLQGYTVTEISTQVNRPDRSVERVLQHIRKRMKSLQQHENTPE